jgi:hypothetical protein
MDGARSVVLGTTKNRSRFFDTPPQRRKAVARDPGSAALAQDGWGTELLYTIREKAINNICCNEYIVCRILKTEQFGAEHNEILLCFARTRRAVCSAGKTAAALRHANERIQQ